MEFETTHLIHFPDLVENLLDNDFSLSLPARGQSMYPQIMSGDVLQISPLKNNSIEKGSIVVYKAGASFVCHRVIRTYYKENLFLCQTRGDSHIFSDPDFPVENICGVVNTIKKHNFTTSRKIASCASNFLIKFGKLHGIIFSAYLSILHSLKKPSRFQRKC